MHLLSHVHLCIKRPANRCKCTVAPKVKAHTKSDRTNMKGNMLKIKKCYKYQNSKKRENMQKC